MKKNLFRLSVFCLILFSCFVNLVSFSYAAGIFGNITDPTVFHSSKGSGLFTLMGNLFSLALTIAGIFAIFQFVSAGYLYLSANGDVKKTEAAWNKIWQSILGLVIIASAFVLARVIGNFLGIDPTQPQIYGP